MALSPSCAIDTDACYRYTLGCQTRHGGFSFCAHPEWGVEQPNAPDTWAALEIAAKLGKPVPKSLPCIAWLRTQQDEFGGYPTLIIGHAVLQALRLLRAEPNRDPRAFVAAWSDRLQLTTTNSRRGQDWLSDVRKIIALRVLYHVGGESEVQGAVTGVLESRCEGDEGYGVAGANLPDTALVLTLAVAVGLPPPSECLTYARRCEGMPDGFNIRPDASSSSLETQLAGLQILNHFGQPPQDPKCIRDYVAGCQSAVGGFGRVPRAIRGSTTRCERSRF